MVLVQKLGNTLMLTMRGDSIIPGGKNNLPKTGVGPGTGDSRKTPIPGKEIASEDEPSASATFVSDRDGLVFSSSRVDTGRKTNFAHFENK
jgi:hypothetical protein